MHEFSLCEVLVKGVLAQLRQLDPATRLVKTSVVVGGLRQIVPEYLQEAYRALTDDTPAAGSELVVRIAPVTGQCNQCGWRGDMPRGIFQCEKCGSRRAEVVGGMELFI